MVDPTARRIILKGSCSQNTMHQMEALLTPVMSARVPAIPLRVSNSRLRTRWSLLLHFYFHVLCIYSTYERWWLKSSHAKKFIWGRHIWCWCLFFLPVESKHCNSDWRSVWTVMETILKNKPHLIPFHVNIIVSLWTFLPTICIYMYICKVKLATIVEGDPKAPFSIATTPRCRGGRYSIPRIAPLYPWTVPYNAEC